MANVEHAEIIGNHSTRAHRGGLVVLQIYGIVFGWSRCMKFRAMKRGVCPTLTICVYDMCVRYAIPTEESMCGPSARATAFFLAEIRPEYATPLGKMPSEQIRALWLLMPAANVFQFTCKP